VAARRAHTTADDVGDRIPQHPALRRGRPRIRSQTKVYVPARRRFQLVLIKPSRYDDDGYVIRWWRAMIPSNSLAALYGIAADCAERQVLGPDIAVAIRGN
jgi:hypothetical protein